MSVSYGPHRLSTHAAPLSSLPFIPVIRPSQSYLYRVGIGQVDQGDPADRENVAAP